MHLYGSLVDYSAWFHGDWGVGLGPLVCQKYAVWLLFGVISFVVATVSAAPIPAGYIHCAVIEMYEACGYRLLTTKTILTLRSN